jgi:hypothetical protein
MNAMYASEKPPSSLLALWCYMLASDYLVEPKYALRWLHDVNSRAFVVDFLQSKGWQVHSYTTPGVDHHQNHPPSHGFFIEDDCDQFICYKLTA